MSQLNPQSAEFKPSGAYGSNPPPLTSGAEGTSDEVSSFERPVPRFHQTQTTHSHSYSSGTSYQPTHEDTMQQQYDMDEMTAVPYSPVPYSPSGMPYGYSASSSTYGHGSPVLQNPHTYQPQQSSPTQTGFPSTKRGQHNHQGSYQSQTSPNSALPPASSSVPFRTLQLQVETALRALLQPTVPNDVAARLVGAQTLLSMLETASTHGFLQLQFESLYTDLESALAADATIAAREIHSPLKSQGNKNNNNRGSNRRQDSATDQRLPISIRSSIISVLGLLLSIWTTQSTIVHQVLCSARVWKHLRKELPAMTPEEMTGEARHKRLVMQTYYVDVLTVWFQSAQQASTSTHSQQLFTCHAAVLPSFLPAFLAFFESIADPNLFVSSVKLLLYLASKHPHNTFSPDQSNIKHTHSLLFQSMVDVMLGWCSSESVDDSIKKIVRRQLSRFRDAWRVQIAVAQQLLQQLLQSMEGITREWKPTSNPTLLPNQSLFISLTHCFSSILQGLEPSPTLLADAIVSRLFRLLSSVLPMADDAKWRQECNRIVLILIKLMKSSLLSHMDEILKFLQQQMQRLIPDGKSLNLAAYSQLRTDERHNILSIHLELLSLLSDNASPTPPTSPTTVPAAIAAFSTSFFFLSSRLHADPAIRMLTHQFLQKSLALSHIVPQYRFVKPILLPSFVGPLEEKAFADMYGSMQSCSLVFLLGEIHLVLLYTRLRHHHRDSPRTPSSTFDSSLSRLLRRWRSEDEEVKEKMEQESSAHGWKIHTQSMENEQHSDNILQLYHPLISSDLDLSQLDDILKSDFELLSDFIPSIPSSQLHKLTLDSVLACLGAKSRYYPPTHASNDFAKSHVSLLSCGVSSARTKQALMLVEDLRRHEWNQWPFVQVEDMSAASTRNQSFSALRDNTSSQINFLYDVFCREADSIHSEQIHLLLIAQEWMMQLMDGSTLTRDFVLRLPVAPLFTNAFIRLTNHSSNHARSCMADLLCQWVRYLISAGLESSNKSNNSEAEFPSFIRDIVSECAQVALQRSQEFDGQVSSAFNRLLQLCRFFIVVPCEHQSAEWVQQQQTAWKREEQQLKKDQLELAKKRRKDDKKQESVKPSVMKSERINTNASSSGLSVATDPFQGSSADSKDRRGDRDSDDSANNSEEGVSSDEEEAELEEDEEEDTLVPDIEEDEGDQQEQDNDKLSSDSADEDGLNNRNRRINDPDASSSEEDSEAESQFSDNSRSPFASQSQSKSPVQSQPHSSMPIPLQTEATALSGHSQVEIEALSQVSNDSSASIEHSQSPANHDVADELSPSILDEEGEQDIEDQDKNLQPTPAPKLPVFALTPAEELAASSPYHALWQEPLPVTFTADEFEKCLDHLMRSLSLGEMDKFTETDWMALVLKGANESSSNSPPSFTDPSHAQLFGSSRVLTSFALVTSCAKYLINHQLRSVHGAALPTLTHLDKILTVNFKARLMGDDKDTPPESNSISAVIPSREPLQHTLAFMDSFEKFILHAAHGSSILPAADVKSRDFFSANLRSCTTFFSRIRGKLIQACMLADDPCATIQHAQRFIEGVLLGLSHVWGIPVSENASLQLNQQDLLNHRQMLETIYDLSHAYIQLRNSSGIEGLQYVLGQQHLLGSTITAKGEMIPTARLSILSLCFFLPAAALQSQGRYEDAIAAYKHALSECSLYPSAIPTPTQFLPNSIALQACIQGLAACHLRLGDFDRMESDMVWCSEIANRWSEVQQSLKHVCPIMLQPLLPSAQTVQDVFRWPVQLRFIQALKAVDRIASRAETQLTAVDREHLLTNTQHLVEGITQSVRVDDPTRSPFALLSSEQQSALSEESLQLALAQRLLEAESNSESDCSVDQLEFSTVRSLTNWTESAAFTSALLSHHTLPVQQQYSGWGSHEQAPPVSFTLSALLQQQVTTALHHLDLPILPAVISSLTQAPLFHTMDSSHFHLLRRSHAAVAVAASKLGQNWKSSSVELDLIFAQHSLSHQNIRLASSLLKMHESSGLSADESQRFRLLSTIAQSDLTNAESVANHIETLKTIAKIPSMPTASDAALTFKLANAVNQSVNLQQPRHDNPAIQASLYLLQLVQNHSSIDVGSSSLNAAHILHSSLNQFPASPTLWFHHGQLFFNRAIQLATIPSAHAHLFPETTSEEDHKPTKTSKKKKHDKIHTYPDASWASETQLHSIQDEDFVSVQQILLQAMPADNVSSSTSLLFLAAVIYSINQVLDSNGVDELVRTVSSGVNIHPPNLSLPPELSEQAATWFTRLQPVLWNALIKASSTLPLLESSSLESIHLNLLKLASFRAIRLIRYAESALHAFIQSQQLLTAETTQSTLKSAHTFAAQHPLIARTEIPLNLLTLVTRFGGEVDLSVLMPALLNLSSSTFLSIFPQLFARLFHGNPSVRCLLHALVSLIGESHPHSVVFPICVSMHEEEEWRKEEDRCRQVEAIGKQAKSPKVSMQSQGVDEVTGKHTQLRLLVSSIDRRSVSTLMQQRATEPQQLQAQVFALFQPQSASSFTFPASHSRSSFTSLLSSVHRVVVELNRVAFLWEDLALWEFRRIQADMDSASTIGIAGSSRVKLLQDEMDFILHASREEKKAGLSDATNSKSVVLQLLHTRYLSVMAPILHQLYELQHATLHTAAATPHELHFQRKYSSALVSLISAIQTPTAEQLHKPLQLLWPSIHAKMTDLKKQLSRLNHLLLKDISPYLARWNASQPQSMYTRPNMSRSTSHVTAPLSDPLALTRSISSNARAISESDGLSHSSNWYSSVSASHAPAIFLSGMQGSEDLYETALPLVGDSSSITSSSSNFIQSFYAHIEILRTKTRPKKLSFAGNDGKMYTYLLKSREDLHLDQRMMQFLQQANRALYQQYRSCQQASPSMECRLSQVNCDKSHVCHTYPTPLYARTFSVIPLSDKSGLIKWQDGVTAIYDFYRQDEARRKEREERAKTLAAKQAKQTPKGVLAIPSSTPVAKPSEPLVPMKASDLFASKLLHHMQLAGLHKNTPRKEVPLHVLVSVYSEMLQEATPNSADLLHRELWLSCVSPADFYHKQLQFLQSLAVMSILGYLIGLGDRHLGNIMLHVSRGEVFHIDYNISLERGLKLPIPEVVPFRLTPILQRVGGVKGIDIQRGNFYQVALITLSAMRQSHQMFTSLLSHSFVHQPLSEWRPITSKPIHNHRKNMDNKLSMQLLASRFEGIRAGSSSSASVSGSVYRLLELQRFATTDSHVFESVEQSMIEFQQLQEIIQLASKHPENKPMEMQALEVVHSAFASFLRLQVAQSEQSLDALQRSADSLPTELTSIFPRIENDLHGLQALFQSTASIVDKQSTVLHSVASTAYLTNIWLKLGGSRIERSSLPPSLQLQEVTTLIGPLQDDRRCFSAAYRHLGRCLESLPLSFHPPSPDQSVALTAVLESADSNVGQLHGRFKLALHHLSGLLLFYRYASDIFNDFDPSASSSASSQQAAPASSSRPLLHSATSTFVFHLLHTYLSAPFPPLTLDSIKSQHLSLLQAQLNHINSWQRQSFGSCTSATPVQAWQTYSQLQQQLLNCHQQLNTRYSQLQKLLLQSMNGVTGDVGEDLNPVSSPLPPSLTLSLYPPSLAPFAIQTRTAYQHVYSVLNVSRDDLNQRLTSPAFLQSVLRANGWSKRAVLSPSSSSLGSSLQIVDDIAVQYAVDHTINLVVVLQFWHFKANIFSKLKTQSTTAAAQAPKIKQRKVTKHSSSASGSSASNLLAVSTQPLVSTVNFFHLHTQVYLLISSLLASISFIPSDFLYHSPSSPLGASSHSVPSHQSQRVKQLYDNRSLELILTYSGELESLAQRAQDRITAEVALLIDSASAQLPTSKSPMSPTTNPVQKVLNNLHDLLDQLRAWEARLSQLLSAASKLLQEEATEQRKKTEYAIKPNYASALLQRSSGRAGGDSKPSQRAQLALHMTQLLVEYRDLKSELKTGAINAQSPLRPTSHERLLALIDDLLASLEHVHLRHARYLAPWTVSKSLAAYLASSAPPSNALATFSSEPSVSFTAEFSSEDVEYAKMFLQLRVQYCSRTLSHLTQLIESELQNADQSLQSQFQLGTSKIGVAVSNEVHAFLDRYAENTLLPYVQNHITAKLYSYLMPQSAELPMAQLIREQQSGAAAASTALPSWLVHSTKTSNHVMLRPTMQEVTMELAQQMHQHPLQEMITSLFESLSSYTLQTITLDSTFHVLQQELQRIAREIEWHSTLLPSYRWQLYRFAWENSTPLFVSLSDQPSLLSQHQQLKEAEITSEMNLRSHHQQVQIMCNTMHSLHPSLLTSLQSINTRSIEYEVSNDVMHPSSLFTGNGSGSLWKFAVGHGVELRQKIIARIQSALDELVSIEMELSHWCSSVFDELEDGLLNAYRQWSSTDRSVEAQCQRVIAESQQRRMVLHTQTQTTAPQIIQLTRDVLQLERYRLDPPSVEANISSGPAEEFLNTTTSLLQGLLHALQHEQRVRTQERQLRGAMQDDENRRALAKEELQWLQENTVAAIPKGASTTRFQAKLLQLVAQQCARWRSRCALLCSPLMPFVDQLTRLTRETKSSFSLVARAVNQTELSREVAKLKGELEMLYGLLTSFVQSPKNAEDSLSLKAAAECVEAFQTTFNLFHQIQLISVEANFESASASPPPTAPTTLVQFTHNLLVALLKVPSLIQATVANTANKSESLNPFVFREEKNKHALAAVRRIQQKLTGIELIWSAKPSNSNPETIANSPSSVSSPLPVAVVAPLDVASQVQLLIQEATKVENLAVLYEGWAPWI